MLTCFDGWLRSIADGGWSVAAVVPRGSASLRLSRAALRRGRRRTLQTRCCSVTRRALGAVRGSPAVASIGIPAAAELCSLVPCVASPGVITAWPHCPTSLPLNAVALLPIGLIVRVGVVLGAVRYSAFALASAVGSAARRGRAIHGAPSVSYCGSRFGSRLVCGLAKVRMNPLAACNSRRWAGLEFGGSREVGGRSRVGPRAADRWGRGGQPLTPKTKPVWFP